MTNMNLRKHRFAAARGGATHTIGTFGEQNQESKTMMRQCTLTWIFIALGAVVPGPSWAQDPFMGAYEGTYQADQSQTTKATAKVIAEGPGYYRVVLQAEPLAPGEPTAQFEIYGVQQGTKVNLFGRANAVHWHGTIAGDRLVADPGLLRHGRGIEEDDAQVAYRRGSAAG